MVTHPISNKPQRAIVIHNPYSGKSNLLAHTIATLKTTTIEIADVIPIAELDSLPNQGEHWKGNGIALAIAAGGDGIVGGVITHIAESDLPLGILPLGTANDIARSLHIPQNISQAVQVLQAGKILNIDIGKAEPAEQSPHTASANQKQPAHKRPTVHKQSYFAHALTTGLNVQFARLATNIATRKRFGHLTYPLSALNVLLNHSAIEMNVYFTGLAMPLKDHTISQLQPAILEETVIFSGRALQVTVINAPVFGGQWNLAIPAASLHDRLLDIVIVDDIGFPRDMKTLAQWLNQLSPTATFQHNQHLYSSQLQAAELSRIPGIHHVQARSVAITTNIDPQDVTLDGEVRGQTPLNASVAEKMLQVLVP